MTAIVVVQLLDQRGPVDGVHPEHGTGLLTNNDNDVGHWFHLQASRLALVSFWASAGWLKDGLGTGETRARHTRPHRAPEPETAGGKRGAHETTHVPKADRNRSPTTNTTNSRH